MKDNQAKTDEDAAQLLHYLAYTEWMRGLGICGSCAMFYSLKATEADYGERETKVDRVGKCNRGGACEEHVRNSWADRR